VSISLSRRRPCDKVEKHCKFIWALATLGLENGGIHLVEMAHIQLWGRIFLHSEAKINSFIPGEPVEATLANFLIDLFHHLKVKIIYAIAFFRSDHTLGHNVRDNHSNVLPPSPGKIPKHMCHFSR